MIIGLIVVSLLAIALGALAFVQSRNLTDLKQRIAKVENKAAFAKSADVAAECLRCQHEGTLVVSEEGRILECNPAAELILGSPKMELQGRSVRDYYALPAAFDEYTSLANREGRMPVRPALLKSSAGNKKLVQLSMSRVGNGDGGQFVHVFRDCADLRTMEERLVQSEQLAMIGKFASQVAHEVRNPLSSISLNLEILRDELQDDKGDGPGLIRTVLKELDRLNDIVGEYLQFSRFPKPHLKKGRIDEVVEQLQESYAPPEGVRLVADLASPSPEVWFDERLIRQALDNLIRNAGDAIDPPGEIRLETDIIDRFLTIRITDTGRGIPSDVQTRLFEPFFTTKAGGTGLGLATTQQIVFEHNGHIQVDSRPGHGSAFSLYIPR